MNKTVTIIVHYGSVDITVDCLKSVYTVKDAPQTVLINNNQDQTLEQKIKPFKKVSMFTPKINLGFAGANNLGIKKAMEMNAQFFILLNNDTLISSDFFQKIISYAQTASEAGLICPKIYFAPGNEYHKNRYRQTERGRVIWYAGGLIDWNNIYAYHRGVDEVDHGQYNDIQETDFATGCCMLIKRNVIEKIGLLNEKYFLYYEDVDYSQTAKLNGFSVHYYPEAVIFHKNAGSSQGPGSLLHQYYQTRNRLYFGFKFSSLRNKLALAKESIAQFLQGGIKRKAIFDFYLSRMGKGDL